LLTVSRTVGYFLARQEAPSFIGTSAGSVCTADAAARQALPISATERPPAKTFSVAFRLSTSTPPPFPPPPLPSFAIPTGTVIVGLILCCLFFWLWFLFVLFTRHDGCLIANSITLSTPRDPPARFAIADVAVQHEGSAQRFPTSLPTWSLNRPSRLNSRRRCPILAQRILIYTTFSRLRKSPIAPPIALPCRRRASSARPSPAQP
jgi:hypothetical protein